MGEGRGLKEQLASGLVKGLKAVLNIKSLGGYGLRYTTVKVLCKIVFLLVCAISFLLWFLTLNKQPLILWFQA